MTYEKRAQKFHTDDASLPRSGQCFWLVMPHGKFDLPSQKHRPDLGSDTSSVWNFCARFSDVIWRGTSGSVSKCRLFSQAIFRIKQCQTWRRLWTTACGPLNHSCGNSILLRNLIYEGNLWRLLLSGSLWKSKKVREGSACKFCQVQNLFVCTT